MLNKGPWKSSLIALVFHALKHLKGQKEPPDILNVVMKIGACQNHKVVLLSYLYIDVTLPSEAFLQLHSVFRIAYFNGGYIHVDDFVRQFLAAILLACLPPFENPRHPFPRFSLILSIRLAKACLQQLLLIACDVIVEGEYHHQQHEGEKRSRGNRQPEVDQDAPQIQRVPHIAEGAGGHHAGGTPLMTDYNMTGLEKTGRGNSWDGQDDQANIQRQVIRQKSRFAQEKRISRPDEQKQDKQYQLPSVTERVFAVLFLHFCLSELMSTVYVRANRLAMSVTEFSELKLLLAVVQFHILNSNNK